MRRLIFDYQGQLDWTVRLGCLGDDWHPDFETKASPPDDPEERERRINSDKWLAEEMRMPLNWELWNREGISPPNNGCAAVKACQLQDPEYGDALARAIRELHYVEGRDPNHLDALMEMAADLTDRYPDFSLEQFEQDLTGAAVDGLEEDFRAIRQVLPGAPDTKVVAGELRYCHPTFVFEANGDAIPVDYKQGPEEYQDYVEAIRKLAPDVEPGPAPSLDECFERFPTWTTEELVQVLRTDREALLPELEAQVDAGSLEVQVVGDEALWRRIEA